MITILQIPTDVFPDDECVVIDKTRPSGGDYTNAPIFSYTFHGDELRWGLVEYFNNTTEERIGSSYYPRGGQLSQTYHNGETVRINELVFNGLAENGKNYKYRYTLFQTDPMQDDAGEYNIYFCRGKIRALPSGATQVATEVYINTEIENLKDAYRYTPSGQATRLVGGAYMEIGEERRLIETYNFNTGKVTLNSAFTTYPTEGTTYKIFTNYILSPYYFVKCRELPTSTLTVTEGNHGLHCQLTYNQANNVGLKCYKIKLYKKNSDGGDYIDGVIAAKDPNNSAIYTISLDEELPAEVDIVGRNIHIERVVGDTPSGQHVTSNYYNYEITSYDRTNSVITINADPSVFSGAKVDARFTIVDDSMTYIDESDWLYTYDLDYTFYTDYKGNSYQFEYTVITQDDVAVTAYKDVTYPASTYTASFNNLSWKALPHEQVVRFTWSGITSETTIVYLMVYRKETRTEQNPRLLRCDPISTYHGIFVDWTAANNHTYEYIFVMFDSGGHTMQSITVEDVITKWEGWSLLSLSEPTDLTKSRIINSGNKTPYQPNGIWTFMAGMTGEDITTHIGVTPHTMTGIKPKTTRNDEFYESGSFGAYVDTLRCVDGSVNDDTSFSDTIQWVKAWVKFVSRQCDFILKSDKGDAWLINISDNPTRNYDNSTLELLTTINYSWIECEDMNEIMLKG